MNSLAQLADFLVGAAFSFYIGLVWLRFLLQWVGADFYNPFSQFVVKATAPVLHRLRRVIPSVAGLDSAALFLIVLLKLAQLTAASLLELGVAMPPLPLLLTAIFALAGALLSFYLVALLVAVVASWLAPPGYSPASQLLQQVVEPVLAPVRRLLPAAGGLDFSPMVLMLLLQVASFFLKMAIGATAPLLHSWVLYTFLASRPVFGYLGS